MKHYMQLYSKSLFLNILYPTSGSKLAAIYLISCVNYNNVLIKKTIFLPLPRKEN